MELLPAFLADVTGVLIFALVAAAVMKIFQIATDIREIKGALQEMKRTAQALASAPLTSRAMGAPASSLSPEELVRVVNAQSYESAVAMEPVVIPPSQQR